MQWPLPKPESKTRLTEAEELEFHQQLIKPGISYIYLCFYILYFAFGGLYFIDFYSHTFTWVGGVQTLRLVAIALTALLHGLMASLSQERLLRHYSALAPCVFLYLMQIAAYTAYVARADAGITELYWSLTSAVVIATIAIYGFARLPARLTMLITVSGFVAALIYLSQVPIGAWHVARLFVHIAIAHVVGFFILISIERRERALFLLAIENRRRSAMEKMLAERAEETLKQKFEAEAATNAKDQFLAALSHELRTPMSTMMQSLALLPKEVSGLTASGHEILEVMQSSSRALMSLLKDILDYARLSTGRIPVHLSEFDVKALAQEAVNLFKSSAQQKNIQLILDTSALGQGPAMVASDRQKLLQVLLNLTGNAVKFTHIGSVICKVSKVGIGAAGPERAQLSFVVTDTGTGIPADYQPHLFTPFTQADSRAEHNAGGVGLGLAITHGLVTALGGSISFTTSEHGTTFTVLVPLGAAATSELAPAAAQEATAPAAATHQSVESRDLAATGESAGGQVRVLLVEDNRYSSTIILMLLKQMGFATALSVDGEAALERVGRGERFDVVLMDCQMPKMDGFEATRAIRKLEQLRGTPRLPIIALTANTSDECCHKCVAAGMDGYLTKPVDSEQLRSTILKSVPSALST